jgi:hypothetical protein
MFIGIVTGFYVFKKIEKFLTLLIQELETRIKANVFELNKAWGEGYQEGYEDAMKEQSLK